MLLFKEIKGRQSVGTRTEGPGRTAEPGDNLVEVMTNNSMQFMKTTFERLAMGPSVYTLDVRHWYLGLS